MIRNIRIHLQYNSHVVNFSHNQIPTYFLMSELFCVHDLMACHILYFVYDFMISQRLITSVSCKAMMCWAPGPLLTSWNQLVFPLRSPQGYGSSLLRQPVSTVVSQQRAGLRIVTVTQHEVNAENDTASHACMQPAVIAVLICDYVTSYYWMTWGGGGGITSLQWGHQYIWVLCREAAARSAGWRTELLPS